MIGVILRIMDIFVSERWLMGFTTTEVFLKIMNMSIAASWVVLMVLMIRLIFRKAPKWVNVLLWSMVAIRLSCPFSIESALSLIPSAQTISPDIMMDPTPEITTGITVLNDVVNPIIANSFTPDPVASANPLQIMIPLYSVIWITGILLMLLYTAVSYLSLRKKVSTAVMLQDHIFQSEYVDSPFVLGIIKPRIYLPYSLEGNSREHVIAHEQAHIRRKDHWWKPIGFLLLSLHWFNPIMWVAYILLCRDIELACDEKVIKMLGSEQRADYTQALLICSVNRRGIAACPLAFGEVGVKSRVKSIMNYRKPGFWVIATALIICVVLAVCFLTDPQDANPNIHELYFSEIGEQAELIQGESNPGPQDTIVSVKFYESSGPTVCSVSVWYRTDRAAWPVLDSVELHISDSCAWNIPSGFGYSIIVSPIEGNSGYASFVVEEQQMENETISFGVQELYGENAGITEIKIRNLHNGKYSSVTDSVHIDAILDFISLVEGYNPTSSKGYYGGSYSIEILNGEKTVFSIGFGDDETFNYGDYSDGYPTRYELRGVSREDVLRFFSQFDTSNPDWGFGIEGSTYEIYNVAPLEELSETYNLEEATIDKCVIIVDGDVRDNQDVWEAFVDKTNRGEAATVRIMHYYHGSETEPAFKCIRDLTYDGSTYQLRWFENGEEYLREYQYLRYFSGEAETDSAKHDAYVRYVLTDNLEATWWELFLSYASSAYGAAIPHDEIYTDLIYYPDYPEIPEVFTSVQLVNKEGNVTVFTDADVLASLQEILSSAEAIGYEPKTYSICCDLILAGADGSIVSLGMDEMGDHFVLDGVFYDYGPGYDEDGSLDATKDLLTLLGLEAWL